MAPSRSLPHFDKATLPLTSDEALMLYEDMVLGRSFEDKCAEMYYRGKMFGFVHLYNGQEAVSTGAIKTLRPDDYVCSTYRDHVHALSKGVPARQVMAELFGKATGCSKGRGGSMHLFSAEYGLLGGFAFVAEGIPVATGAAFQTHYRRNALNDTSSDQVTLCFFGDGASNNGQFFECLNMAALWKLPIIFVIENNEWAIGMAHYRATSVPEIYKKAAAFGMVGVEVDGMDVMAVRAATLEAVQRARCGEGPTVIEALTYRFRGHSLADPDELRSRTDKEFWMSRDPIKTFATYALDQGIVTQADLSAIDQKVAELVDEAVHFAESSPEPAPQDLHHYIYAD